MSASVVYVRPATYVPRVHPNDPHRFVVNGSTWYLAGYTPGLSMLIDQANPNTSRYQSLMDRMAANGINSFRNWFTAGQLVEKELARPTIRIITANLCTVINHNIEDRILTYNPDARLTKFFKQAKVAHEKIEPLTFEEVPKFLEAAKALDTKKRYRDVPDYYPLFLCAVHTGLRSGELAGLQWGDIDWNGTFLLVRRTFQKKER